MSPLVGLPTAPTIVDVRIDEDYRRSATDAWLAAPRLSGPCQLGDGLGDESGPGEELAAALARDFGSVERWRSEFIGMGNALAGGSGWVLLSWSPRDRRLVNQWAADHCHTLAGGQPIVALDMYEHSYHIDYGAKAATYVDTFMNAIRWSNADKWFAQHSKVI